VVEFTEGSGQTGWHARRWRPGSRRRWRSPRRKRFGKPAAYMGEGGTIPFMGMLGESFPTPSSSSPECWAALQCHGPTNSAHSDGQARDLGGGAPGRGAPRQARWITGDVTLEHPNPVDVDRVPRQRADGQNDPIVVPSSRDWSAGTHQTKRANAPPRRSDKNTPRRPFGARVSERRDWDTPTSQTTPYVIPRVAWNLSRGEMPAGRNAPTQTRASRTPLEHTRHRARPAKF